MEDKMDKGRRKMEGLAMMLQGDINLVFRLKNTFKNMDLLKLE